MLCEQTVDFLEQFCLLRKILRLLLRIDFKAAEIQEQFLGFQFEIWHPKAGSYRIQGRKYTLQLRAGRE